jgi:hypothetical protein
MSKEAYQLGRQAVSVISERANQLVLRRIHCANLGEKRKYWENKWGKWVMSDHLEDIFPDIESLDALWRPTP